MFDQGKTGFIEAAKLSTILNTLGHTFDEDELVALIEANDPEGKCFHSTFSYFHQIVYIMSCSYYTSFL